MIPKEKAIKLVEKYATWSWNETICDYEVAKQCALIAVDTTIYSLKLVHKPKYVHIFIQNEYMNINEAVEYLEEVKQEIKKL